jgi:hypothetical protein
MKASKSYSMGTKFRVSHRHKRTNSRELEDKLAGLEKQTNERTRRRIENAREYVLAYRND